MSYPYFAKGLDQASLQAEKIPTVNRTQMEDAKNYKPHPDLRHAVNVALILGMPLLVTGAPGTGKTQLAYTVGAELGCNVLRFETKSSSQARDLFYTYDALSAFKMREQTDPRLFIHYQALGQAIMEAFGADTPRLEQLLPPGIAHHGPRRTVVLIDEIDKAPRDFPNDLLNEIDRLFFRVPELHNAGTPGSEPGEDGVSPQYRPIIIMTSNSEKGLPDAFLRRCVYFDIPFPTAAELRDIVAGRIAGLAENDALLTDALDLFQKLRGGERGVSLRKTPSTAELLNWLQILLHRGAEPHERLADKRELLSETLFTLAKSGEDQRIARSYVLDRWSPG